MSYADGSAESLRDRLQKLEAELQRRNDHVARLEKVNKELSARVQEASVGGQSPGEISEIEETLKRVLTRHAMIVQGNKCVFMVHDRENEELFADTPAFGFEPEDLKKMRIKVSEGVSGEVFRETRPIIMYDSETDDRAQAECWKEMGVKNGLCVPLIVERRDEETNAVLDRRTIGVLWVLNKKFGNIFFDEDVSLLERMAKNTAAVINSAESFRQVLREKEEVVETIESLTMGLIMVNRNERISQMNQSAMRIFGISKDDLAGGKTFDAVIKDDGVRDLIRRALTEDAELSEEVTLADTHNPEQQHVFQVQSATVRNDSGDTLGTAAIFNDITEIKNVDKMKTAFVSTVSHELRTPLTSIKGFISTLVGDTEGFYDDEMRREFYTIIDTECDRLRRLIDDLLNVSRIENGATLEMNVAPFNLRETLEKVVTIQNGSTYKRPTHALQLEINGDLPQEIEADQDKVEQIFHNVVGNALKYSPSGGPVTIAGHIVGVNKEGVPMIEFAVSDKGLGMSEAFLKKVGEKFARADNRDTRTIGGTGIGLFLVKAFVEGHGGKMWPTSEGEGKGSTFHFTMPVKQPEEGGGSLSGAVAA